MRLMEGLRDVGERAGVGFLVQGVGSTFWTTFTDKPGIHDYREHAACTDPEKYTRFAAAMLERGVRLSTNGRWHMASTHTDDEIEKTVGTAYDALRAT
jgi:glutamate-1-semialdehyde aminotransferase